MSRTVELAPGRLAHASGCLWLPEIQTVLIADVHLGYGWALRRRGQPGPVTDGGVHRKLRETLAELQPDTVVFLGDLVHAPRPGPAEREAVEDALRAIEARIVLVPGNHDRAFARDYPALSIEIRDQWTGGGVVAVHGDRELPAGDHIVAGHLHPAFGVTDHAGASRRMPAFIAGERITLLPAFSPLAAGFDVTAGLPFPVRDPRVAVSSGKRVVLLGLLSRLR